MKCDGVSGLLSAFIDGELSAGELLRVEQHLRRCHCCADEVDALRQTVLLLSSLKEVEVPPAFRTQLHERLVALGPPMSIGRRPLAAGWQKGIGRWALPAAAAAAALAIGFSSLSSMDGSPSGLLGDDVVMTAPGMTPSVAIEPQTPDPVTAPPTPEVPAEPTGSGAAPESVAEQPVLPTGGQEDNPVAPPPPSGPTHTNPDGAGIAATGSSETVTSEKPLQPLFSYDVTITGVADSAESVRSSLLSRYSSVSQRGGMFMITVPFTSWEQEKEYLSSLGGESAEVTAKTLDLAPRIQEALALMERRGQELETFDQKMATLTDPADREQAQQERAVVQANLEDATESALRLQELVEMVTVTFQLQTLNP